MNVDSTSIRKFLLDEYLQEGGMNPKDFIKGMVWFEGLMSDQLDKQRLQDSVPDNHVVRILETKLAEKEETINVLKRRIKDYKTLGKNERQILKKDAQYKDLWRTIERLKADNDRMTLQLKKLGVTIYSEVDVTEKNTNIEENKTDTSQQEEKPDFKNIKVYSSRNGEKLLIDCEINGKKTMPKPLRPEDKELYEKTESKGNENKINSIKYHLAQKYFKKELKVEIIKPRLIG